MNNDRAIIAKLFDDIITRIRSSNTTQEKELRLRQVFSVIILKTLDTMCSIFNISPSQKKIINKLDELQVMIDGYQRFADINLIRSNIDEEIQELRRGLFRLEMLVTIEAYDGKEFSHDLVENPISPNLDIPKPKDFTRRVRAEIIRSFYDIIQSSFSPKEGKEIVVDKILTDIRCANPRLRSYIPKTYSSLKESIKNPSKNN